MEANCPENVRLPKTGRNIDRASRKCNAAFTIGAAFTVARRGNSLGPCSEKLSKQEIGGADQPELILDLSL